VRLQASAFVRMTTAPGPLPTRRLFLRVLAPSLLVVCLLAALSIGSVKLLSAVRAYVGGESLWSKSRSQAVHHLQAYGLTRDPQDYRHYEQALVLPEGDRQARLAMLRPTLDKQTAWQGLLVGGTHPDDIDNMITVFRLFGNQWIFKDALQAWTHGDELLDELRQTGNQLHADIQVHADDAHIQGLLLRIADLDTKLLSQERRFSSSLATAARVTEQLMVVTLCSMTIGLSLGSIWLLRRALQRQARQEQALRTANERWELAVASAELGLFEFDVQEGVLHFDAKSAQLHGHGETPCSVPRSAIRQAIIQEDRDQTTEAMNEAIANKQVFKLRYRIRHTNGQVCHIESTGRLNGQSARAIGVVRDVTDEIAQAQLAVQRDAAEKVAAAQRRFLSRLSHELRTPLNAILGFAQLLTLNQKEPLPATQQQQVQWILGAGQQLLSLVEDVLDLSKVEAGEISMHLQAVDLHETVHSCLPLVDAIRQHHGVHLTDHTKSEPWRVLADPQRLQQVLINLLTNGCKYNRPGGEVSVAAQLEGQQVRIDIQDNGLGLSQADAAELFQPFKRVQATTAHAEGTGLGLYIVKQLVERMNGSVSISSQPGVGSCLTVRLPAA
jgi:signal transduction histidine kinase